MFLTFLLLAAFPLFASAAPFAVKPFLRVPRAEVPPSLALYFCADKNHVVAKDCLSSFRKSSEVWKAPVSESGVVAWWIFPGFQFAGSGGPNNFLLRRNGNEWVSLLNLCSEDIEPNCEDHWQTIRPRSDVLPTVRRGYHDLRIEVDRCIKWNGKVYVDYKSEDYHRLLPEWFDATNFNEAEIFWAIRYAGIDKIALEPQWFPIPHGEIVSLEDWKRSERAGHPVKPPKFWRPLGEMPHWPDTVLEDSELGIQWVGLVRGATWGIRGDQGFLLHPRRANLGSRQFQIVDDWLYVYEGIDDEVKPGDALARYNRRTGQLELLTGELDSGP